MCTKPKSTNDIDRFLYESRQEGAFCIVLTIIAFAAGLALIAYAIYNLNAL
ncbi:MAG: hypothetical protein PHD06_11210 [Bacteroidales bacterium]|nr:hypothetical protein [Bacteroidales bacterium]MDD4385731.1 hypothetical protein [Bacteroidales bacterium]